jgi:hypothetical protein
MYVKEKKNSRHIVEVVVSNEVYCVLLNCSRDTKFVYSINHLFLIYWFRFA